MKFSMRKLLAAFFLVCIAAAPAALGQSNSIKVTCLDSSGQPLKDIIVSVQNLQTGVRTEDKSDKKGIAEIKKLDDGVYRTWAKPEGFAPAYYEFIQLTGNASESVQLTFEPGSNLEGFYFDDQATMEKLNQLIMDGAAAFQQAQYDVAEEKLKAAIEVNPKTPDALQNLAILYLQNNRMDEAEETLKQTRDVLEVFVAIYKDTPHSEMMQQRLAEVGRVLDSMPLQRIHAEADEALRTRDYEKAIAGYEKLIQMSPDNAALHYNLALALAHADRLDEAESQIDRALELKPGDDGFEKLKTQIGEIKEQGLSLRASKVLEEVQGLLDKDEHAGALAKSESELANMPEDYKWRLHAFMAEAHIGLNRPDDAVAAYGKAIESATDKANLQKELAQFLIDQERYEEAVAAYKSALESESKPIAPGLFELGQNFSRKGHSAPAAMVFEKVVSLDPAFAKAYYELGLHHYYDTKDYVKAKELLTKFLSLGGEQADVDNAQTVLQVMARKK